MWIKVSIKKIQFVCMGWGEKEKLKICNFSRLIWDRTEQSKTHLDLVIKTRLYKVNILARFAFFSVWNHVVAIWLLSGQPRPEDAACAHEGAPKERACRGPIPGTAPARGQCAASWASVSSAARRRHAPMQRVQRHGVVLHQRWHPGGHKVLAGHPGVLSGRKLRRFREPGWPPVSIALHSHQQWHSCHRAKQGSGPGFQSLEESWGQWITLRLESLATSDENKIISCLLIFWWPFFICSHLFF